MADAKVDVAAKIAFACAIVIVLCAVALDRGSINWMAAPFVYGLLFFAMSRVPLRHSLMWVMFFAFTLENPSEAPAAGLWQSPLYDLGALMMSHMNQSTGVSWMSFSALDVILMFLVGLAWYRHKTRSKMDGVDRTLTPKPLIQLSFLSLAGMMFVWTRGLLRDGDYSKSLWQLEKVSYLPILFLLFQAAIKKPQDYRALGKIVLAAAVVRACLAIYVMRFSDAAAQVPAWGTTHHDSMLFAAAIVIIVSVLMHRANKNMLRWALVLLPIIVWGMVDNNRRMVWVQIILVFVTLYFATPMSPAKKKVRKYLIALSPLILAYLVIGWGSPTGIFKPVSTLRSVIEPATDVSTMTRDIENYNLAQTIRAFPLLGLGYGHQFYQLISLPPMPYPLEPWLPHNSLLGLWFAAGFVGYTSITLLWTAGVYLGVRAYRASTEPMDRAAALVSFGSVLIYMIQCYGDIGLGAPTGVYMVAASLAVAGRLSVVTGAWSQKAAVKRPRVNISWGGLRRPKA